MESTREEYLKAKAIVEAYERQEYEDNMRLAEQELFDDQPDNDEFCLICACNHSDDEPCGREEEREIESYNVEDLI